MASQTEGIQKLLAAEKKADEKVTQARKRKIVKLKKAKDEAQAEVLKYRKEKEQKFSEYEEQHMGSKESNMAKMEESTVMKIESMQEMVASNKSAVIDYLIGQVFLVDAKVHINFRSHT